MGGGGAGWDGRSSFPPIIEDAVAADDADDDGRPPPQGLEEDQWQCAICTLINRASDARCDACESWRGEGVDGGGGRTVDRDDGVGVADDNDDENSGRTTTTTTTTTTGAIRGPAVASPRPPDPAIVADRLAGWDWTNVDRVDDGAHDVFAVGGTMGTFARVLNGAINGAIVGAVYGGAIGGAFGATIGGLGGAVADARLRRREEDGVVGGGDGMPGWTSSLFADWPPPSREGADGGRSSSSSVGGTRMVRSDDGHYLMAVHRDRGGRGDRMIRVRYGVRRPTSMTTTTTTTAVGPGGMGGNDHLERALIDALARMSYLGGVGRAVPGRRNVILQPTESFEELVARFGLGTEGRGASREVIDSYPVEVIVRGGERDASTTTGGGSRDDGTDRTATKEGERSPNEENDESGFGTCGICLEDYRVGEERKMLSCPNHPHSFHAECIDKWLTVVASCPICKSAVMMYEPATTS